VKEVALKIFKELFWDNIVEATLTELFMKVPLLGWGPIGYVITHFVLMYSNILFEGLTLFVDVKSIRILNREFQEAYDFASLKLMMVAAELGPESEHFRKVRDDSKEALKNLVQFGVTRSS